MKDIECIVKINYDKDEFGHLITQFVGEMIRSIKENKELNDAVWDSSTIFVDEQEVSEYFGYCVFLTVQTY